MGSYDDFISTLRNFRKHKLRSALAVSAIAISVASIVVLVSVADAMLRDKMRYFKDAGAQLSQIVLLDQRGLEEFGDDLENLKDINVYSFARMDYKPVKDWHDGDLIKSASNGKIRAISPVLQSKDNVQMSAGRMKAGSFMLGVTDDFFNVIAPKPVAGRVFTRQEVDEAKNVVLAAWAIQREQIACELSKTEEADYDKMDAIYGKSETNYAGTPHTLLTDEKLVTRLESTEFKVLGLLPSEFPVIERFFRWNWCLIAPITTLRALTGQDSANMFLFYPEGDTQEAFEAIKPTLAKLYPDATPVLRSAEAWAKQERMTLGATATGFVLIGLGTLLVSIVVIMNTMLVSVRQRRLEVGLRKALGASRQDIARQFRNETLALCLVGIAAGLLLSAGLAVLVEKSQSSLLAPFLQMISRQKEGGAGGTAMAGHGWQLSFFTVALAGAGAAVATLLSALAASLLPARAAAQLDPVACLSKADFDETKSFRKLPGFLRSAWARPFTEDPERSWLAISAIAMGVAVVIVLTSVGEYGRRRATLMMQFVGADDISLQLYSLVEKKKFPKIDLDFVRSVPKECPHVTNARAWLDPKERPTLRTAALSLEKERDFQKNHIWGALGVREDVMEFRPALTITGEAITREDIDQRKPVAVLEEHAARKLFPTGDALGGVVEVNGIKFTVKGVIAPPSGLSEEQWGGVMIPWTFGRQCLATEGAVTLQMHTTSPELAGKEIIDYYQRHYGVTFESTEQLIWKDGDYVRKVRRMAWLEACLVMLLGMGTLLVGGIGMMNTMLMSTTARINEIGVQRALGASRGRIIRQFLFESAVLSLGGGLVGIAAGAVFSHYGLPLLYLAWDQEKLWPSVLSLHWPLIALACAVLVGMASALGPAFKASLIRPADALRYE